MPLDATIPVAVPATLGQYTRLALIVPELRERDTAGIIGELSQVLQRQGCVTDVLPFYHTALNQELLCSSGLECGLAFPHARVGGVRQLTFALGRTPEPVTWGANGPWRAQLVFLLAVPATDAACYLNLLASLARLGQQTEALGQLRAAQNAEAILAVLERIRMRQG
jgi:mannitol/fructose-specific phosphotransferase system IIA component (Ntr-type)